MLRRLEYKCHFCSTCEGLGCVGEMPGMGGAFSSANFIENVAGWKKLAAQTLPQTADSPAALQTSQLLEKLQEEGLSLPAIRLAPMTGAVENVGYQDERTFYFDLIIASCSAGIRLSIGDGCPDEKLLFGIEAVKAAKEQGIANAILVGDEAKIKEIADNKYLEILDKVFHKYGRKLEETLPLEYINRHGLLDFKSSVKLLHYPNSLDEINLAYNRFKYEELLKYQLSMKNKPNR